MDSDPASSLAFIAVIGVCGLAAWSWMIGKWQTGHSVLPLEPRRPVPWEGVDLLLILAAFVLIESLCLEVGLRLANVPRPIDWKDPSEQIKMVALSSDMLARIAALLVAIAILTLRARATETDLGLNAAKIPFDLKCGAIAFAAAIPVVYVVQLATQLLVKYEHPLINAIEEQPDRLTWLLVTVSAVIVAPISEEFFFRGLLQGWFEKIELAVANKSSLRETASTVDESLSNAGESGGPQSAAGHRGLMNLPLGAVPILLSSTLFALTHLGQGAAPIPLFVLALVLGFLYQRTHRLLPSIVVHFLLNAITMAMLFSMSHAKPH